MHWVTISSSASHSSSKSCIWLTTSTLDTVQSWAATLCVKLQPGNFTNVNFPQYLTRVHVSPFLSIINGFKNLQNVNQLVCLLLFEWSFPWVFYSTFHQVFPFPDYISSKLNKFGETWTFACLCFKTSTLNPNFQFTCVWKHLYPVFKADLSLVSISTEVEMKPTPWMLRFGQGRHPSRLGRGQAPPAQIMFSIVTAFHSPLLLRPPLFMDKAFSNSFTFISSIIWLSQ